MDAGFVSHVQDFCVHDGDGIRTTVFLSGCPLRCLWCANPETWELLHGESKTVAEIVRRCSRNRIFFHHSGGGVTFSGGEPGFQPEFVHALATALNAEGFTLAMETCGYFSWEAMQPALELLDLLFFDIKHSDNSSHQALTGKSNTLILKNLAKAGQLLENLVVRLPLVPGVNDQPENLRATADIIRGCLQIPRMEILPYHNWSQKKYEQLGLEWSAYDIPSTDAIRRAKSVLEECGIIIVDYK